MSKKKNRNKKKIRRDSWSNVYAGIGKKNDKSIYTNFTSSVTLSDRLLSDLWCGDGFAAKVVRTIPDDMTREGVMIENDTENVIDKKLDDLDSDLVFNQALIWKRLYGGGVVVMGVNDQQDLEEEINENNIQSIDWLRVYPRTQIDLPFENFDTDTQSKFYGMPEFYTIMPMRYGVQYRVHRSRVLEFKGVMVPPDRESGNLWYWGMSALQQIWDQIKDIAAGERNLSKLLYELVIGKIKIKGLSSLIASKDWEAIHNMVEAIDLGKSTINSMILDADGDDFGRDTVNVAGFDKILQVFMSFLAGVAGYPITRLFGQSAMGMNATGDGDEKNYNAEVEAAQNTTLRKPYQRLVDLINMSKEIVKKVTNPTVKFNPLFQQTQTEIITNQKIQADIDNIYMQNSVLSPEEVRENRFANGYSHDTVVEGEIEFEEEEEVEDESLT